MGLGFLAAETCWMLAGCGDWREGGEWGGEGGRKGGAEGRKGGGGGGGTGRWKQEALEVEGAGEPVDGEGPANLPRCSRFTIPRNTVQLVSLHS